jgi:hypothetical protein
LDRWRTVEGQCSLRSDCTRCASRRPTRRYPQQGGWCVGGTGSEAGRLLIQVIDAMPGRRRQPVRPVLTPIAVKPCPAWSPDMDPRFTVTCDQFWPMVSVEVGGDDVLKRRVRAKHLRGARRRQPDVEERGLAAVQHDVVMPAVPVEVDRQRWLRRSGRAWQQADTQTCHPQCPARREYAATHSVSYSRVYPASTRVSNGHPALLERRGRSVSSGPVADRAEPVISASRPPAP